MPEPIASIPSAPALPAEESAPVPSSRGPITTLGLVDAPVNLSELAQGCADRVAGLAVATAGTARHPAVMALISLKAGFDIAACVYDGLHQADVDATILECTRRGGTPVGILEHSVSCQGVKR
jgi:hypothetical protein